MSTYPKHYLADVPQALRLRVLDLCIHRQWHDALDLLHENGFTQYEWYEVVWFHDHAPTNLEPQESKTLTASPGTLTPLESLTPPTETLTVARTVPGEPNLNAATSNLNSMPVKGPKPRSKVGKLPKETQDNLNAMLANGCTYAGIIRWLTDRGYPGFNKVNLHNWRSKRALELKPAVTSLLAASLNS